MTFDWSRVIGHDPAVKRHTGEMLAGENVVRDCAPRRVRGHCRCLKQWKPMCFKNRPLQGAPPPMHIVRRGTRRIENSKSGCRKIV